MSTSRIYLSRPHMSGHEQRYIAEAFEQNWIAPLGHNVTMFEKCVKDYVGSRAALALCSGTAALHLALIESGVTTGDIVFCSSLTFCATANPIIYQGATPVFIDSDPDTWNMSVQALQKAFEKYEAQGIKPKAVIVVHLYGQCAHIEEIQRLCEHYDVILIEDAAESLGATFQQKQTGTFGHYGIFSFNGNKIITTSGGGMLVSDEEAHIQHALFLATQARDPALHYQHSELGYNYRLSNISAGIGRGQMEVLDEHIARRREIFDAYQRAFSHLKGVRFQQELIGSQGNRWLTAILIDENLSKVTALELIKALDEHDIESRPVWKPMHLQPYYQQYDYIYNGYDHSRYIFEHGICLPSSSDMTEVQQQKVIDIVVSMFHRV